MLRRSLSANIELDLVRGAGLCSLRVDLAREVRTLLNEGKLATMSPDNERRLVILDDDALVGLLIESAARLDGVVTCLTREADEFYDAVAECHPTHVVIDLTMPETSGEQVLSELAMRGCRARIIVASGADAERLGRALAQARDEGLDVAGGLPKPFAAAALHALLA